jgi:hypothetical protein
MPATAEERATTACSFCMKPYTDVGTLVAGPGVFICNECVALCTQIIESKPAGAPRPRTAWEYVTTLDQALEHLPRIAAASAQVELNLTGWVRHARELGATWARIGEALGMTRQSAWERFSGEE